MGFIKIYILDKESIQSSIIQERVYLMEFVCESCKIGESGESGESCTKGGGGMGGHESVILYSTGCPRCIVLSKKLAQSGIPFTVVSDVDKMIEMGFQTAPILSVNGKTMEFGDAVRWVNRNQKIA